MLCKRRHADTPIPPIRFPSRPSIKQALAAGLLFLRAADPYEFRYGRFARASKNSQLTCGDITIICETVH